MCVMMFLASRRTPTESKCTPSGIRWSALMFVLSMNPQCLRVVIDSSSSLASYAVQLQEEADCNEAIWCKLVTGHTIVTIVVVYRCPNITKQNNEKIHNAISEVCKGDCIIMGDFNHGNIKWDSLQSTGIEDQILLCLVQDNFLTQHVLEPTRAARVLYIVLSSHK